MCRQRNEIVHNIIDRLLSLQLTVRALGTPISLIVNCHHCLMALLCHLPNSVILI